MTEARLCAANWGRRTQRQCSLKLVLGIVALLCGCRSPLHRDEGAPRVRILQSLVLSSDGTKAAFICDVPGKRPDQWFSYRYVIVDLDRGMLLSSSRPDGPMWDRILGWSEKRQAFIVQREWPLGPMNDHPRVKLEILSSSPKGGEKTVCVWPRLVSPLDEASEGGVSFFRLTSRQDGVLFAENVGIPARPEQQRERVGIVDLDSGRRTSLSLLPTGWHCRTMTDQTGDGQVKRVLVVATKGPRPRGEVGLFMVDKTRAERSSVSLPREPWILGSSPQGPTLALALERSDGRYDVRIVPLGEGAGEARTVLTLDHRLSASWAPNGRDVLLWTTLYPHGLRGREPWWLIDTLTDRVKRVAPGWKVIEAVQWEPQGESLVVVGDGALWRWNPTDNSSRYVMALPAIGSPARRAALPRPTAMTPRTNSTLRSPPPRAPPTPMMPTATPP